MSTPTVATHSPSPVSQPSNVEAVPTAFKNILYATDFSEFSVKALPWATALAQKFGSQLYVCHVITPTPLAVGAPEAAPYLYQTEHENADRALKDLAASGRLQGLPAKLLLPSGLLSEELSRVMNENKVDLLVAGTHGRTGVRRLLLGSAVEEMCRIATCPVLTVGPDVAASPGHKISRILVPSDTSDESVRALPHVVRLAQATGASVSVLHVMPEDAATNPDAKKLAEPVRKSLLHSYEHWFAGTEVKPEFVIEFGDTVETILTYARRNKADLIALGVRHAFLPGLQLRSSVAYRVISGSHCPVLTCR
jgi:nucleotide-binding universal stress UspA family protein